MRTGWYFTVASSPAGTGASQAPPYPPQSPPGITPSLKKRCRGFFRFAAGGRFLHRHFNFTESAVETAPKSLRRSCTSELTRQGTSLRHVKHPTTRPLKVRLSEVHS